MIKRWQWVLLGVTAAAALILSIMVYGRNTWAGGGNGRGNSQINDGIPRIRSVSVKENGDYNSAELCWEAMEGCKFQVLRKVKGEKKYEVCATLAEGETVYLDQKLEPGTDYTYTVRAAKAAGDSNEYGDYDEEGITTISSYVDIDVDYHNLYTDLSWSGIQGVDSYAVYRKFGSEKYRRLDTLNASVNSYKDLYHDTCTDDEKKNVLIREYFLDMSDNPASYTVRGRSLVDGKESLGIYHAKGSFTLSMPIIVDAKILDNGRIKLVWASVAKAEQYYIFTGSKKPDGSIEWHRTAKVPADGSDKYKMSFDLADQRDTYYTVQAVAHSNGEAIFSEYDETITLDQAVHADTSILFLGDSITVGVPYTATMTNNKIYSYPWRVSKLTGADYYNASVSGATYAYVEDKTEAQSICRNMVDKIAKGITPYAMTSESGEKVLMTDLNGRNLADFDIIVMAGGTNDYSNLVPMGADKDTDQHTFRGAVRGMLDKIASADQVRKKTGKAPIKVVYLSIFYGRKIESGYLDTSGRYDTVNEIGLTLQDYEDSLEDMMEEFKAAGHEVYRFDTKDYVNEDNWELTTADSLHLTREAYARIGSGLAAMLLDQVVQ